MFNVDFVSLFVTLNSKLIRYLHIYAVTCGTFPHPPNTDRWEVRNSITLQFNGTGNGPIVAHLFNDGTIKTSAEMHQENNERRARGERLAAEEGKFPT